jgi:hypothetical protein
LVRVLSQAEERTRWFGFDYTDCGIEICGKACGRVRGGGGCDSELREPGQEYRDGEVALVPCPGKEAGLPWGGGGLIYRVIGVTTSALNHAAASGDVPALERLI